MASLLTVTGVVWLSLKRPSQVRTYARIAKRVSRKKSQVFFIAEKDTLNELLSVIQSETTAHKARIIKHI